MTDSSGIFGSIHEAALYDFPEMTLRRDTASARTLRASLAPMPDGVKAVTPSRFTTPWRTIQIGRKATDLINSSMILNLNEPCRIDDISWIKPQKYIGCGGVCISVHRPGPWDRATVPQRPMPYYTLTLPRPTIYRVYSSRGWNEGWENWGGNQHFDYIKAYADFDIDSIARYAAANGIELWAHNEDRRQYSGI